jgi:FKBP-type peptidyl-prolyl cis-trans isomerase FklB
MSAAGMMLAGSIPAQQTPASNSQSTSSTNTQQSSSTSGGQQSSTAKKSPTTRPRQGTTAAKKPLTLTTPKDKVSYALGMNLGTNLQKQSIDVDPAIILQGLKDALAAGKTLMTEEQERTALTELQNDVRKKQQEKMKELGETNKKEGDAFLVANKTKEGVVELPSGLQYKILQEGTGPKPTAADSVVCNYRGTLLNSKEFDSSYKRGQPATFPVSGVIKGWTEALQLMPVGSKWQLFIPADLAYGDQPPPGSDIGPGDTLIFDVELLSIGEKK